MRKLPALISVIALLATAAVGITASDRTFSLAVDDDGVVWMARCAANEAVLAIWDGNAWHETARYAAPDCSAVDLVSFTGGVAAAWIEARGAALAFSGDKRIFRPEVLSGVSELAISALADGGLGILGLTPGGLHWTEFDPAGGEIISIRAIPAGGRISSLSVAHARQTWLAWQEKTEGGIFIVAANPPGTPDRQTHRFRVKGFAAAADPVLTADENSVQLVWQGTRDKYYSVLRTRALSADGLGSIRTVSPPEGVNGMLAPRAFAGRKAGVSAYGWGAGGWRALRVDIGDDKQATVRSDESMGLRTPQLAVDNAGEELWISAGGEEATAEPVVRTGTQLSSVLPAEDPPPEPLDGVTYALAFGDSITAGKESTPDKSQKWFTPGYTSYLAKKYSKRIREMLVIQSGVSGENTSVAEWEDSSAVLSEGLVRLPGELDKYPYAKFVLILEGTNDAFRDKLTAEEIAENLGTMVDMVRDKDGMIPVLATLLPRFDDNVAIRERAENVSEAIVPMAHLRGVTLCDFQEEFPAIKNYFSDERLHPDQEGYEKMAEIWLETLLTFEGDIDRSFKVDEQDLLRLASSLRARRGSRAFNPDADFNDDGVVDVKDLSKLLEAFGLKF